MELHLTAMECHLPYGITPATQHKWTHPMLTPARQAGSRFIYPGGMEGRVDLSDRLHRWFTCPQTVTHPSTNPAAQGWELNLQLPV